MRFIVKAFSWLSALFLAQPAFAQTSIWGMNLLEAASPVKERIHQFHDLLLVIIFGIAIFVTLVLFYTIWRYRSGRGHTPSKTTHHVPLEIVWTLVPCIILAVIMWFSFPLMYYSDVAKKPEVTLKATGYQWYWGYSYPELEIEEYSNYLVPPAELDPKNETAALRMQPTYQRMLSTYDLASGAPSFVVLPVGKQVRVLTTAADVIHSWAMPALGVKKDAVPGRLNETWLEIERPGIYYGQCSEICGIKHGYMPIEIRAVPPAQFKAWTKQMKKDPELAMAQVQADTAQYAHAQLGLKTPLTLENVWQKLEAYFKG